jgi:hypothetical protein
MFDSIEMTILIRKVMKRSASAILIASSVWEPQKGSERERGREGDRERG